MLINFFVTPSTHFFCVQVNFEFDAGEDLLAVDSSLSNEVHPTLMETTMGFALQGDALVKVKDSFTLNSFRLLLR